MIKIIKENKANATVIISKGNIIEGCILDFENIFTVAF